MNRLRTLIPVLALLLTLSAWAQLAVPQLTQRVTDLAGVLTADQRAALDEELRRYEDSTSNQFVVLIIPSLQGEPAEDYGIRVTEANGIGQKGKDNGLLLLVSVEDRKIRIEVGYGLEGAIPDAISAGITSQIIAPRFRQGDYFGGIRDGLHALMQAAAGEYTAEPRSDSEEGLGIGAIIAVFIIIVIARAIFRGGRGGRGGGPRGDGLGGLLPWLIASQMAGRGGGGGGWSSGGGWGGGGSGGGFSGGGGSFGGGGSTGSW